MVSIRLIPCLDIKDGRVVKGVNFKGLRDAGDPVARRTLQVIGEAGLEVPAGAEVEALCYATGDVTAFEHTVDRLRAAGAALPPLRISRPVA